MTTNSLGSSTTPLSLPGNIGAGAAAGILGGIVFGIMMTAMGMMPMIASLAGSDSAGVGWVIHLVISATIGGIYGLLLGSVANSLNTGWWIGLLYGAAWWILGPLLIMPAMMGMGPQFGAALSMPMLLSLVGHLAFGVITGVAYLFVRPRLH